MLLISYFSFTVDVTDSYIRLVCLNHIHILCRYYLRRDSKVVLLFVFLAAWVEAKPGFDRDGKHENSVARH